jgi:hypothetical protein
MPSNDLTKSGFLKYQTEDSFTKIDVMLEKDTVWRPSVESTRQFFAAFQNKMRLCMTNYTIFGILCNFRKRRY